MERGLPLSTQYRLLRQNKRNLVVMRSEIHNWGLFTLEAAVKDAMLLEYMGQMVRLAVGDRREKTYSLDGTGKVQVACSISTLDNANLGCCMQFNLSSSPSLPSSDIRGVLCISLELCCIGGRLLHVSLG